MSRSPAYEWNATHRPWSEITGPDADPNVVFGGPASRVRDEIDRDRGERLRRCRRRRVHVTDLTDVEVVRDVAAVAADVGLAGVVGDQPHRGGRSVEDGDELLIRRLCPDRQIGGERVERDQAAVTGDRRVVRVPGARRRRPPCVRSPALRWRGCVGPTPTTLDGVGLYGAGARPYVRRRRCRRRRARPWRRPRERPVPAAARSRPARTCCQCAEHVDVEPVRPGDHRPSADSAGAGTSVGS